MKGIIMKAEQAHDNPSRHRDKGAAMKKPRVIIDKVNVWCAHDSIIPLKRLKPHPKNPNTHPDKQIELLAKIITQQGWRKAITISNRSGFITAGHGRLMAAKKAGLTKAPVEYQDYENEAAELADLVADNKIAELAFFNDEILEDIMAENVSIEMMGIDINDYLDENHKRQPVLNEEKIEIKAFKKTHILLSFPPDKFIKIQKTLENVININGMEYEQSSN